VKIIAWLTGIGTLVAAGAYMVVSLNRWEWNRALFFGLILLVAEVALATGLVLRKLGAIEARAARPEAEVLEIVRSNRPAPPDRFRWLRDTGTGQMQVFITFLVGGGVLLSAVAWVVDRIASHTATPVAEHRLAAQLARVSYPTGGLLVDDVIALAQDVPGADDAQLRRLLGRPPAP
jgi:hypothetical protein